MLIRFPRLFLPKRLSVVGLVLLPGSDLYRVPSAALSGTVDRSGCQRDLARGRRVGGPLYQMISLIRFPSVMSATSRNIEVTRTNRSVASVAWITSLRVGQVTRPSSARELRRY